MFNPTATTDVIYKGDGPSISALNFVKAVSSFPTNELKFCSECSDVLYVEAVIPNGIANKVLSNTMSVVIHREGNLEASELKRATD